MKKMKKIAKPLVVVMLVVAMLLPTASTLFSSAAETAYPVELGFNNLFIFETWANNENSTSVVFGGAKDVGTLAANIADGSFRLTKTSTEVPQAYTGHGESKTNSVSNTDYYIIPVEPNTAYSFSYHLQGSVSAEAFSPFVFMFDSNSLLKTLYDVPATAKGDNSFMFITPADVTQVQFRFTISDDGTPYADVSKITLNKCNVMLNSTNLFNLNSWADNAKSRVPASDFGYDDGTILPNKSTQSITLTTNNGSSTSGNLFSSFSFENNNGYYNIDVEPNTAYVFNYNIVNTLGVDFVNFTPYFVRNRADGSFIDYIPGSAASGYGPNSCIFTTTSETEYISVVLSVAHNNTTWTCEIKNIELLKSTKIENNKYNPHRFVKTYGEDATYGTLPTPPTPENYIFAGWTTNEDGSGLLITADTPVQPRSYTVYPRFEPKVDSLTIVSEPVKKVYTRGEKLDTTGLVLEATIIGKTDADGDGAIDPNTTFTISSGHRCTPEILNTAGTQTITVNYGGKTVTFNVTVKESDPGVVVINGVSKDVTIANGEYTFNYSTSAFNRYEVTYKSDSYVSGVATFNDGKTEEFFLEPSESGSFASYVDKFLDGNTYNQLVKIKFTTLDKANGNFELIALNTVSVADPGDTIYFKNSRYEMGVALNYGGSVSELYDLGNSVYARTYANGSKDITQIDYLNKLNENYGSGYKQQSDRVNLINTLDRGRYLQQSYYGTGDKPYVQSEYNNADWPYNPVQGGNVIGEASKIIDYKVTEEYVYVKARPLDWAKWSDEYAATDSRYEAIWGDDYITDTYVEAWYYFQGDSIKVTNRKVDYSGLPEASHSQEFPALYLVEPLNHFVYNNVSSQDAWKTPSDQLYNNYQTIDYTDNNRANHWKAEHQSGKLINYEEPEYWGLTQLYKDYHGMQDFEPWVTVNENWAAFTASEDSDSFGVGIYTDTTNKFYYGVQPTMYVQTAGDTEGSVGGTTDDPEYRHAQTINPSPELPTSYIAPTDTMLFRSYEPTEFTYYLTTGKVSDIRDEFETINSNNAKDELSKPKFAVPETVYLKPTTSAKYTDGQYYVNNVMNKNNYYQLETTTESNGMYLGMHVEGGTNFKVNLTNVDNPNNDVFVSDETKNNNNYENVWFDLTDGTIEFPVSAHALGLHFSGEGLAPGEKATVRWDISIKYSDGTEEVYTAYTVMYAPHRTVGAVAEARQVNASQNEISSWITGANGVDHSQRAPLGSYHGDYHDSGYFRQDPLAYPNTPPTGGSGESEEDYIIIDQINGPGTSIDYTENSYVLQTATNGHDSSRSQSYLGLLTVDGSRYTNTNQIPNLKIGWDALRCGSAYPNNSFERYTTYYTLGTAQSYTATSLSEAPGGWTTYSDYDQLVKALGGENKLPYRETHVPEYKVSEIDGKYIHALNQAMCIQTLVASRYSTAGTSVLCSVTDKSALRDSVLDGYGVKDPSPEFLEKLENAATILGDPSASQEDIDNAQKELDDTLTEILNVLYALKYDNLFSMYEFSQHPSNMAVINGGTSTYNDRTLTVVNGTITGGEAYTSYGSGDQFYKIALSPNTEYVFEYDVTTDVKSQAFLFFYNARNENSEKPTNITVQTNGGAWASKNEANSWIGNYGNAGTYHYVIKFTTGATTTQVGFRFGNTSNDPTTSTFSNVKLIDAERYYADVEYASVEELHKEYESYGALPVLTRPGYTFNGWKDEKGNTVSGANVATKHESIFSQWTISKYTITYDANGGSVSPTSQLYTVETTLTIPTPTRGGYIFQGWKVTETDGNWELNGICSPGEVPARMYGNAKLTAQWSLSEIPVYFDTILDFSKWNTTSAGNATISNVTANGFTLTSNAGAGEGTSESPEFPVTAGKQYYIDIDFTGDNWDVYIFFRNETTGGTGINFNDGTNRFSSNGTGIASRTFTAPEGATKAVIRVDANGSSNAVTFSDIRVYEADTRASDVNVPDSSFTVQYGDSFGVLPVPTREGYTFNGWYDENGNKVTDNSTVNYTSAVYLKSKWVINNDALVSDTVVIDFASPIDIKPLANDKVYNAVNTTKKFLGFSADGTNYGAAAINGTYGNFTVNGDTVTYTPTKAVNGAEKLFYRATVTEEGVTTTIQDEITVVPASNILYEDNLFKTNTLVNGVDWTTDGTAVNATQSNDAVYGYDSNVNGYNKIANYSNGSALKVNVTNTAKTSRIIYFDFTGKAFDLIGACGDETGMYVVSLKNNDTGKMVKSYIVDTYYSDYDDEGLSRYGDTLYQVPIISETELEDYANYTVQIVASYLPSAGALKTNSVETQSVDGITVNTTSDFDTDALRVALEEVGMEDVLNAETVEVIWFDDDSTFNGGLGVNTPVEGTVETAALTSLLNIIDSFRVYYPIENGNSYYSATEQNAVYYNVVDNLLNQGTLTGADLFAYISGKDNETVSIETYAEVGPKDELYLSGATKAVSFKINGFTKDTKVMVSLRAATGSPKVKFGDKGQFDVKSNTEMYYDITNYIAADGTVVIQNITPNTLLSVGSLKITGEAVETASISPDIDLEVARAMMMAVAEDVEPNVPDVPADPEVPDEPNEPENPDEPNEPGEPEEPEDPQEPATPEEPENECWLIRFIRSVIERLLYFFNLLMGILRF